VAYSILYFVLLGRQQQSAIDVVSFSIDELMTMQSGIASCDRSRTDAEIHCAYSDRSTGACETFP